MKYNNRVFSRIVPLLLVCMASDAALLLLYANKRKHHAVVSRGVVRRVNPVIAVSQSRDVIEHQVIKRQLQELATMPANIRVERLPRLLENLQTFPGVKLQDPKLEQQIRQAFSKAQAEIRPLKGAIIPERSVTVQKPVETQMKAPENAEQIASYVLSIIEKATGLSKKASVFEQLNLTFKKADDVWLAHKEDPLDNLKKATSAHFLLSKTLDEMIEKQYFVQKETVDEIMEVFQEKDVQKVRELVKHEISYWLLFDLVHNSQKIDANALQEVVLARAVNLFTFTFNNVKGTLILGEKLPKIGSQIRSIVGTEVLQKFFNAHKADKPRDMPNNMWLIKQKDLLIKHLPAEQQAQVLPLLQEGSRLLEQIEAAKKDNEQAMDSLKQTGFFAPQPVTEQDQPEIQQVPPQQKKGMSLGTKIAIGLMSAIVLGGGYMIYKEYAGQQQGDKSLSGAAKSAGGNVMGQISSAIDGIRGLFGRAKTFVTDKFAKDQTK